MRNTVSTSSTLHPRSYGRIFLLAVIAVLAVGIAVAPRRAIAQQAAPAATASQPSVTTAAKAPESSEDTADDEASNKFRHNPLVKSSAKVLHLSVETTARLFEFINFGIVVLAIGIPLYKFLPKFLRNRAEKVRADIESARKETEDATSRLSAEEAKLARLGLDPATAQKAAAGRAEVEPEADLVEEVLRHWPGTWEQVHQEKHLKEAPLLSLAIDKAKTTLGWTPQWDFARTVAETVAWYRANDSGNSSMHEFTQKQIQSYCR